MIGDKNNTLRFTLNMTTVNKNIGYQKAAGQKKPLAQNAYLRLALPPEKNIHATTSRMIRDHGLHISNFAAWAIQDPILVIELLRRANAIRFSRDAEISSVHTAVIRLGEDSVSGILTSLKTRRPFKDQEMQGLFEMYRDKARRTSIIAKYMANWLLSSFSEKCQTAAVLSTMGDMLAIASLGDEYLMLARSQVRAQINYLLKRDYSFDIEKAALKYLRLNGVPDFLVDTLSHDAKLSSKEQNTMRTICFAAEELVNAFDAHKWEKMAPGEPLPSKSYIRLLCMDARQYAKIFSVATKYLYSVRQKNERSDTTDS